MLDLSQALDTMIRQQLRTNGVLDDALLELIRNTPREDFIPGEYRDFAYSNVVIPLAHQQQMLLPEEEGLVLQAVAIQPTDEVLEIGTGSGYMTALFSQLAKRVTTVDIFQDILDAAQQLTWFQKQPNIIWQCGDAAQAPLNTDMTYDVIVISGGLYNLPLAYLECLRPGGRLVVTLGSPTIMQTILFTKVQESLSQKTLFETVIPYLINATKPNEFKF